MFYLQCCSFLPTQEYRLLLIHIPNVRHEDKENMSVRQMDVFCVDLYVD